MNTSKTERRLNLQTKYSSSSVNIFSPLSSRKTLSNFNLKENKTQNQIYPQKNKLRLTSISLSINRNNYDNKHIFEKRNSYYNKSIEENKKVFKYRKYILFDKMNKISSNRRNIRAKKIEHNLFKLDKLFLTDEVINIKEMFLPILNDLSSKSVKRIIKNKKRIINNAQINNLKNNTQINNLKNNINNLKIFEPQKIDEEPKEINDNIIGKLKTFAYIRNRDLIPSVYLTDLKKYLTNKFSKNIKREKIRTLKENADAKIDYLNKKIEDLRENYNIFENNFYKKYNAYLKQMDSIRNFEVSKNNEYAKQESELKQVVYLLRHKIKKIEINNNSFKHWMYFQICIKEHLINLPDYYKAILESKNIKNLDIIHKLDRKKINDILKYKNKIIYKTADEFLNQFKKIENKNLELLLNYNLLKTQIMNLSETKNNLLKYYDFEEFNKEYNETLRIKIKFLEMLKKENKQLEKNIGPLKKKNKIKENDLPKKHSILYYKCIKISENIKKNINYDLEDKEFKDIEEETIILRYLKKFEFLLNFLLERKESYKEIYPEKMNNIQIKLDKEKKILKNIEKMNIARQKYEEEREKIIRKSNKILILPTHKMNIDYKKFKNKININPKELAEIGEKNTITNMLFGN